MVIIIGTKLDMASEPDEFTSKSSQLFNSENVFDKSENEKNLKESSKSTDDADCKLEQIDSKSLIPPTITSKDPFAPEVENTESILNNSLYPNNFSKYTGESLNTPSSSSSSSQRPHRQVTSQEACDYALQSGAVYFETSAKENINVTKVFDLIGFQLLGSRIIEEKTVSVTTQIHSPSLPTIQKRDSSSCCTIS